MRGDTLPDMEDLDGAVSDARPQLRLQQLVGHGIVMLGDRDVVVEPGTALLPLRINIRRHRQRLQGWLIKLDEQLLPTGPEMA